MAYSSTAGGFPVATATGFYACSAALQTNEGKHWLTFICNCLSAMSYYSLRFIHDNPLCLCVCVCRTWRRRRSISDTPRAWTPWYLLPSLGSLSTSQRCAAAREEVGSEWVEEVSTCYMCSRTNEVKVWVVQVDIRLGKLMKHSTCSLPTSHLLSSCSTCSFLTLSSLPHFPTWDLFVSQSYYWASVCICETQAAHFNECWDVTCVGFFSTSFCTAASLKPSL